jgi:hypothetical protein
MPLYQPVWCAALLPAANNMFTYECKIAEIAYKDCVILHTYMVYIVALTVANNFSPYYLYNLQGI